jgi:hypothetical protein
MKAPQKLYNYCPFGVYSLRAISQAEIFHASPHQFNDPLDCNPTLDLDITTTDAVRLLRAMLEQRGESAANVDREIANLRYLATDPGDDGAITPADEEQALRSLLARDILGELNKEMAHHGVLAVSETYKSVLMWSHYGDHHKGLCLEYDTSLFDLATLAPVDYRAARTVLAHDLLRWKVDGNATAEAKARQTYFFSKSGERSYEREWRDISPRAGVATLHFKLTAVHLGMRADFAIRQTIAKALAQNRDIDLFSMWAHQKTFELERSEEDRDYLEQSIAREPPFIVFGRFREPPLPPVGG